MATATTWAAPEAMLVQTHRATQRPTALVVWTPTVMAGRLLVMDSRRMRPSGATPTGTATRTATAAFVRPNAVERHRRGRVRRQSVRLQRRQVPARPTQWYDIDGDGYGDNLDGQNYDAFLAEPSRWSDVDGDGCGDNPAGRNPDLFIYDPTQCEDNDGDGWGDNLSGNNPDPYLFDFDNDGYNDSIDVLPKLFSPQTDNDGSPDAEDAFPSNLLESSILTAT